MNARFFYTQRPIPKQGTYRLKRQVVAEYQSRLANAIGLKKDWLRWKRGITLLSKHNELLFSSHKLAVSVS